MLPKVLVFTPVYEDKDYCFKDFIENAKKFSYPNRKHIIIDNSKTPDYFNKISEMLKDEPFEVYRVERGATTREALARAQAFARRMAIDEDYDYLFSLESDIFPHHNILEALMLNNVEVVSGLYFIGSDLNGKMLRVPCATIFVPHASIEGLNGTRLLMPREQEEFCKPALRKVAAAGMGCCLIQRHVFMLIPFMFEPDLKGHSDIWFFNDCHRKGFPVFVDTAVPCEHRFSEWEGRADY